MKQWCAKQSHWKKWKGTWWKWQQNSASRNKSAAKDAARALVDAMPRALDVKQ
jgi:hypothetical protein